MRFVQFLFFKHALVKKIFLCGAAERFSAASFWEGGNVDGRKKRRDSKNTRTASGAG